MVKNLGLLETILLAGMAIVVMVFVVLTSGFVKIETPVGGIISDVVSPLAVNGFVVMLGIATVIFAVRPILIEWIKHKK